MQGASSAWQTVVGVWQGWALRQPEQLPGPTSNTNKILLQLARPCQALEFHKIKALGWRCAPAEIGTVYCANKPEVHCS